MIEVAAKKAGGRRPGAGRKRKITPSVVDEMCSAIEDGMSINEACILAQIDEATLYREYKRTPELQKRFTLARVRGKRFLLKALVRCTKSDPRVALEAVKFRLERQYRDEWGRNDDRQPPVSVSVGVQVVNVEEDANWYGNGPQDHLAQAAPPSITAAVEPGAVQGGGERPAMGEDSRGITGGA